MKINLYDSYSRSVREFSPIDDEYVRIYACGPTVYDYAHIGNLRTYIFEDVLCRTLRFHGYKLKHVMNITDVGHLTSDADSGDDKVESSAQKQGRSAEDIAEFYIQEFRCDLVKLHIGFPDIWCRATDHIQEQIDNIKCMQEKGYTYFTGDGVYFDTSKLSSYGYLARLDLAGLDAGKRVQMGEKKNISDFALWKFTPMGTQRQMEWKSPWGIGFPGWHIECSAMAVKYLGEKFDIHCGGKDHIPVHHTNEIAQAEACYGSKMANFWLHGYFLELDKEKMSKSRGGFIRLQTLLDRGYDPVDFRYLCLMAHYRNDMKFTWDSLDGAHKTLGRLRKMIAELPESVGQVDTASLNQFMSCVYDDLNTTKGLAVLWKVIKSDLDLVVKKDTILKFDEILGLGLSTWQSLPEVTIPDEVQDLIDQRTAARADRDWQAADTIRHQIHQLGYDVKDTVDGSKAFQKTGLS